MNIALSAITACLVAGSAYATGFSDLQTRSPFPSSEVRPITSRRRDRALSSIRLVG